MIIAWTKDDGAGAVTAAFVGEGTFARRGRNYPTRQPAARQCHSMEDARKWVQREAQALGVAVKWLDQAPDPYQPPTA